MIVTNNGTETINLVINGFVVAVKPTQACVIAEKEYTALSKLFPALQPLEAQEAAIEEETATEEKPEAPVKQPKRKKKTK